MDQLLIILITVLITLMVVFIGLLAYFGNRFLNLREKENEASIVPHHKEKNKADDIQEIKPEVLQSLRATKKVKTPSPSLYCVDHPEEFSSGKCAISGDLFCEHCLTKQGEVKISRKYLDLYLDSEWVEVAMFLNSESSKDKKDRILLVKKELWDNEELPMLVQGHYKINVDEDEIEEFTVVFVREADKDFVKKELAFN